MPTTVLDPLPDDADAGDIDADTAVADLPHALAAVRATADGVDADARARLAAVLEEGEEGEEGGGGGGAASAAAAASPPPPPTTQPADPDAAAVHAAVEATLREEVARAWEAADTARERVSGGWDGMGWMDGRRRGAVEALSLTLSLISHTQKKN
jgi:hypothetical protein